MEEIMARHTGQDLEKVAKDMDRDYYMTAQEAQDYGIIDTVVTSRTEQAKPGRGLGRRAISR